MNQIEIWKNVCGYEDDYEVSSFGNVRRKIKNLKHNTNGDGYSSVSLCKNGKCKSVLIHRLVAEAFLKKEDGKSIVNHMDCNKRNNHVLNLEWTTYSENSIHAVKNGKWANYKGENNNMVKLSVDDVVFIKELIKQGKTTYKIHKEHFPHLHQQTIYAIKQGRLWSHIQI